MGNHLEVIRQNDSWSLSIELVANTSPRGADFWFYIQVQFITVFSATGCTQVPL